MCLPDFIEFKDVPKDSPIVGYRNWINPIKTLDLKSESRDYIWLPEHAEIAHKVKGSDSGIYAYNNYYSNYYYNNYYYYYNNYYYYYNNYYYSNYYNYYYYYNNYYNNYYNLGGIIHQFGRTAIHKSGQRSEFAKITSLFSIRESDAKGPEEFLAWIKEFNSHIWKIAERYHVDSIISWQDFVESQKNKVEVK